jgi:hypothetical protein
MVAACAIFKTFHFAFVVAMSRLLLQQAVVLIFNIESQAQNCQKNCKYKMAIIRRRGCK